MSKNRTLLDSIASRVSNTDEDESLSRGHSGARPSHLESNLGGITNPRAPGQSQSKILGTDLQRALWVEAKRCRPWKHHNRAYDLLDENRCSDLISGFRSQGRQQRPAIVRPIEEGSSEEGGSDEYVFEIIAGVRRHWTVAWLNEHSELNRSGEPYRFLVIVRDDLDDTKAFELSDADNRGQKDISDFERAVEYRWALQSLYDGNVSRMAETIQMDRSHLSRLVALTEMPEPIVTAYPSILDIKSHHWRELSTYFSTKERDKRAAAERVLACARAISDARSNGSLNVPNDGPETLKLLLDALKEKTRGTDRSQVLKSIQAKKTGKLMLRIRRTTRGMTMEIPRASGATKEELSEELLRALDDYYEV